MALYVYTKCASDTLRKDHARVYKILALKYNRDIINFICRLYIHIKRDARARAQRKSRPSKDTSGVCALLRRRRCCFSPSVRGTIIINYTN